MKFGKVILAAAAIAAFSASASAQHNGGGHGQGARNGGDRGQWRVIGSREVADHLERDVISGRGDGRFRQIRICVAHRAVRFQDVDIVFGNGGRQDVRMRERIGRGECTRAIDLKGERRFIRRIIFRYETIRDRGRQARVTVFGR